MGLLFSEQNACGCSPGETLVTKMWNPEPGTGRVIFIAEVKETGKQCIANAFLDMEVGAKL